MTPETIFEKSDGRFTNVKVVYDAGYYTLYVNYEENSSVHESEPRALEGMIEEAESYFDETSQQQEWPVGKPAYKPEEQWKQ